MQIAIVGTGSIGSTFAFHLARAGHAVTVVARGARLAQLQAENAIVKVSGERAPVTVHAALDGSVAYDLVLVTVLAGQVNAVLPALQASAAKSVMFMFNTFEPLGRLRDAVGASRFVFGFPAIFATLPEGKLKCDIYTVGQTTIVTDAGWARVFSDAGIVTNVENRMHDWLRTHAALVVPLMTLAVRAHTHGAGVPWSDVKAYSRAMAEAFELVRALGNSVVPSALVPLSRTPEALLTPMLWGFGRTKIAQEMGGIGTHEATMLIDAMVAASPDKTPALRAIRP